MIVIVRQSPRTFVERVDFITSVGYGSRPGHAASGSGCPAAGRSR